MTFEGGVELAARVLLDRYGVVFRRLCTREPWLPPWRELVAVYRRREARGELRGGRFLALASGEQFALPEAVGLLREVCRRVRARVIRRWVGHRLFFDFVIGILDIAILRVYTPIMKERQRGR